VKPTDSPARGAYRRADQRAVDLARRLHRGVTACFVMALKTTRSIWRSLGALLLQHLGTCQEIASPCDQVGCEDQAVGALQRFGDVAEAAGSWDHLPDHLNWRRID
jgi:hypothetical protein